MGVFQDSVAIFKSSWNILWKDKELLLFPCIAAVSITCVLFVFFASFHSQRLYPDGVEVLRNDPFHYLLWPYLYWFITIFALHFIINVINAAIVASTMRRLSGENPTIASDFMDVLKHWKQITGWTFLVAVFVFLMNFFKRRGLLQRIIGYTIEIAASLAFFFVVPIMMIENVGPFNAIKRSVKLLGGCWGNQIVARTGLYLVISLIQIPAIILLVISFDITDPNRIRIAHFSTLGISVLYIVVVVAIYNALNEIVRAVLYLYARDGKVPVGFSEESLRLAFRPHETVLREAKFAEVHKVYKTRKGAGRTRS